MKKFTIVMASAMIALGASAAAEKVWEGTFDYGNWADPTTITSPKFASAKAGDIITMVYDDVQSGAQYQLAFFDTGDKWTEAVPYADIAGTMATYTLTGKAIGSSSLTDVEMLANSGFATKDQKAVLKAVYFGDEYEPEKPTGTEVVWEGTDELGSWNNDIAIGDKDNAFAKLFKGDKIIFNFSQADADAQIQINTKVGSDWKWTTMVDADPITNKKYVFTVPEDMLTWIQSRGVIIKGQNATLSSVEIDHGTGSGSAVETIAVDENAPVEIYTLDGRRVNAMEQGIYIVRQGNKTMKVIK